MKKLSLEIIFNTSLAMKIYDSHTHLNQELLFPKREELFFSFIQNWWAWLVNAWANENYNTRGIEIAKRCKENYPEVFVKCALGWHPCDVENIHWDLDEERAHLKDLIIQNREEVVAIGECWIDLHYWKIEGLEKQKRYFRAQCELAQELELPIVIHSRDGFSETFEVLKDFKDLVVYIHCWGYSAKEIEIMVASFPKLFIGFCWNISYKNAENLRESVKVLPLEKLLIETDAPYLSPQGFRWKENSPEMVGIIWKYIAELLCVSEEALWEQVEKNFYTLYRR